MRRMAQAARHAPGIAAEMHTLPIVLSILTCTPVPHSLAKHCTCMLRHVYCSSPFSPSVVQMATQRCMQNMNELGFPVA